MNELDALTRELKRRLPPVADDLAASQLGRLLRDPRVRRPQRPRRWLQLAVSAAIIGVLSLLPSAPHVQTPEAEHWFFAEHSALEQVLADGSRLHLELGTQGLSKDGATDGVRFELERGRATFDVVPQRGRTFRVLAGKHSVSVIGTRFSVAYEPGGAFSVSVERGSVLVTPDGVSPIRLAAGERFDQAGPELARSSGAVSSGAVPAEAGGAVSAEAGSAEPEDAPPEVSVAPAHSALPKPTVQRSSASHGAAHEPGWRQLYLRRKYAAALAAARALGLGRLTNELGPAALTDLADVARLGGDAALALEVLTAIQRRFPGTEQAAQAQFLSGRLLVQLGRSSEAAPIFESYLGAHPDAALSTEALGRLLELYANEGDTARARGVAERYLKRAPHGPYRRLARSVIPEQ